MSVAKPVSVTTNGVLHGGGIVVPETVVAPRRQQQTVPNHLLDTKIFHKIGQNDRLQARPAVVHFGGFQLGKLHTQTLRIANLSTDIQQMHVIPPNTRYFQIKYKKMERLVPGLTQDITIEFTPDEWRYYYDCLRIHTSGEENLTIPVHAYPVMSTTDFPEVYYFPPTPVGQSKTKLIPLRCEAPIDFEFQLSFVKQHAAFSVTPLSGVVPANGQTDIAVTFTPSEFATAVMKLQLIISQFNTAPLVCTFTGHSEPGLAGMIAEYESIEKPKDDSFEEEGPVLDPRELSPLNMSRRRRRSKKQSRGGPPGVGGVPGVGGGTPPEFEVNGVHFSNNLDNPYAVSLVLNQEPGRMRAKDLREAVLAKKEASTPNTRQMKEALFDHEVKADVLTERKNQLKWQIHLGSDQITSSQKLEVLAARKVAEKEYHLQRGDPLPEVEYRRACSTCSRHRIHRRAGWAPPIKATFDPYNNDPWAMRHRWLGLFQRAARKVIIRLRVDKRTKDCRRLVQDYRGGKLGREPSATYDATKVAASQLEIPLVISSVAVKSFAFPTYIPPSLKDDMAPDALGDVPYKKTEVVVKKKVEYADLKVPQQFKLMSYKPHSVHGAAAGYVTPKLVKPLRTGAQDELVTVAVPELPQAWDAEDSEEVEAAAAAAVMEPVSTALQLTEQQPLRPPSALFKPVEYPPLHIFNPAPGLQVFLPPLPYAENDPDFYLCPLPRYMQTPDPTNKQALTLKKFVDREDVIRGVMQWKKFPSQGLVSLASTPTLTNVWVPRWTDPFLTDLLPTEAPPLLNSLPDEDRENMEYSDDEEEEGEETAKLSKEKELKVVLTPEMVNSLFTMINTSDAVAPETEDNDEFPYGSKLPTHNNPVSSTGPVPRERRERELDMFLKRKYNRLGDKIQGRVTHVNNMLNQKDLVLK